jgi:hypothetical protein
MHPMKITNASQGNSIYKYMNTKLKLLNCNANIYFSKKCLAENLTPKYALTKTNVSTHNKTRDLQEIKKIQITRIKMKLNFGIIRQHLNKILYSLHLETASNWKNLWYIIYLNIESKIKQKMETKYDTLNNKTKKLEQDKGNNSINNNRHTFFKRTINITDISFTYTL